MIGRRAFLKSAAALTAAGRLLADNDHPPVRDFERRIFDRNNEIRVHFGSPVLVWNDVLWAEASLQSARKAILQFPGHTDPERGDIAERLTARSIAWSECGENMFSEIGYDDPVNLATVCWWYSPGHRETLMKPNFTESAVGVAIGPDRRIYATQIFVAPPNAVLQTRKTGKRNARHTGERCAREEKSPADSDPRAHQSNLFRRLFGRG